MIRTFSGSVLRRASVVFGTLLLSGSISGSAEPNQGPDLAERYLKALYSVDFALLEALTDEAIVFHDSTSAELPGGPWRFEGRKAVIDFFRASVEGVESTGFEVIRKFESADHTVLELVYWTRGDGAQLGAPGVTLHLRVPAVTVIRTRDGRVIEHQDFVDYPELLRQVEEQVAAANR